MANLSESLAATGERVSLRPAGPARLDVVRTRDRAVVGSLEVQEGRLPAELVIWQLCIEPPERGYGCGSEAALLAVQRAFGAGWETLRARAHPEFGLSVYFWVRMGFRPLHGEGPEGGIWLERRRAP